MRRSFYKAVAISVTLLISVESVGLAAIKTNAKCLNDKGKMSDCSVENNDGNLIVNYKSKKESDLNRTIIGTKIQRLTGGEFAKRRVGTAVALGILVAPLALFMLFSKKKIENFGVYLNDNDKPDALLIQTGKKESYAVITLLQSASGKEVEYPEVEKKEVKKEDKSKDKSAEK